MKIWGNSYNYPKPYHNDFVEAIIKRDFPDNNYRMLWFQSIESLVIVDNNHKRIQTWPLEVIEDILYINGFKPWLYN
jgi:hypothetical protein